MARMRIIKPTFFTHDVLCELSPLHRILYAGLWCYADRRGILEDRPKYLKTVVLPYDTADVDTMLRDLADRGFIVRYVVDGRRLMSIPRLVHHQHFHKDERCSDLPGPGGHLASTVPARCQHQAPTVPAPGQHHTGTGPAPCEHPAPAVLTPGEQDASTVQAPEEHPASRPVIGNREVGSGKWEAELSAEARAADAAPAAPPARTPPDAPPAPAPEAEPEPAAEPEPEHRPPLKLRPVEPPAPKAEKAEPKLSHQQRLFAELLAIREEYVPGAVPNLLAAKDVNALLKPIVAAVVDDGVLFEAYRLYCEAPWAQATSPPCCVRRFVKHASEFIHKATREAS